MTEVIILDTGPLVAFYHLRDTHHQWAWETFNSLSDPFITCEAVLSEACFLLARKGGNPLPIIHAVREGMIRPELSVRIEAPTLEVLMKRYSDMPMSLADACLVRLSELHKTCRILTVDRHFHQYRRYGRSVIPLISPW